MYNTRAGDSDSETLKDNHSQKGGHNVKEVLWLGSSWICRKRRMHYKSFSRNGVRISVYDFVYVLAEEDKRLVAYLEDMYEDSRGNKMVVVRWFHRIDEVGIVLPHNFSDRKIFFSLCHQDLSIECIDGLATILSPKDYKKYMMEATHTQLQPFVCNEQFDNDDVKPFDITQLKGYANQELVRYMHSASYSKRYGSPQQPDDDTIDEENVNDYSSGTRPKKKHCLSKDDDLSLKFAFNEDFIKSTAFKEQHDSKNGSRYMKAEKVNTAVLPQKEHMPQFSPHIKVGSEVEVLSQDSGIRGCWFRALIIKKHKDKVKVQYQDLQNAIDETKKLEEWIMASKVALTDQSGIRISGRKTVRPSQKLLFKDQWGFDVGSIVDVWWHDGWWEGIVIRKDNDDKFHVYFPGEKRDSIFCVDDLRLSREWVAERWIDVKGRADLVGSIVAGMKTKQAEVKLCNLNSIQAAINDEQLRSKDEAECCDHPVVSELNKAASLQPIHGLLKDDWLWQVNWKSKKRRQGCRRPVLKFQCTDNKTINAHEVKTSRKCERFMLPTSLKADNDNCKYLGDALFSSSVVPPLTSLVMSR